ncbi:DUF1491 family protein [Novosphingobium sp. MBES04]|uniref:DUF1491 family protein n=1 Tax=Novosphingobium sp. MBES04 TaxID=1206458 RepID=UPI00057DE6B1|nr:DUF1491 family protein [Novosphingobium sp. MBES04]GAM04582.1 hypothetical conserved protein [Novosphingobium sp. MBES04]
MDARLPAHMEVSALIRRIESEGGFGMVLSKGERDAGTLMVVLVERGRDSRAYERMPQLDGTRKWTLSREQDPEKPWEFSEFLERRGKQDPDLWIVELDIADGVRFIEAE